LKHGWTKWEAVQLPDKLEATQAMTMADWEYWKEADKQQEALDLQINGIFCLSGMTYLSRLFKTWINI
jgi:hypothetical protein